MSDRCASSGRRIVDSVLEYFSRYQRLATLRNDRRALWHFEECWTLVCESYYGRYSLPAHNYNLPEPIDISSAPVERPPWFQQKYSRPNRKVIARITEHVRCSPDAECIQVHYDVLECGHRLESHQNYGGQPAQHRRCGLCPPDVGRMHKHGAERISDHTASKEITNHA